MKDKKYMILIVKYDESSEIEIEELIESIKARINGKYGKLLRAYKGPDEKIVSAVEKILKLTE